MIIKLLLMRTLLHLMRVSQYYCMLILLEKKMSRTDKVDTFRLFIHKLIMGNQYWTQVSYGVNKVVIVIMEANELALQ